MTHREVEELLVLAAEVGTVLGAIVPAVEGHLLR